MQMILAVACAVLICGGIFTLAAGWETYRFQSRFIGGLIMVFAASALLSSFMVGKWCLERCSDCPW